MTSISGLWTAGIALTQDAATPPAAPQAQGVNPVGMPGAGGAGQGAGAQPLQAQPAGPGASSQPGSMMIWYLLPVMLLVMIVFSTMSGRKEKRRREEMLSTMKKGDRVVTSGGMIGTIAEMTDTEVVLRVEEGRIRFAKSAVQGLLGSSKGAKDSAITEPKDQVKAGV